MPAAEPAEVTGQQLQMRHHWQVSLPLNCLELYQDSENALALTPSSCPIKQLEVAFIHTAGLVQ